MKNRLLKKLLASILTIVTVLGAFTACGDTANNSSSNSSADSSNSLAAEESAGDDLNQAVTLNIAYQPVVGFLPVYILKDSGSLQEALAAAGYGDVEVVYTAFESGPVENEAFASDLQDIGVIGNVPAVSAIAAGQNRKIIGIAYNGEQSQAVLVAKDSDVSSVTDLKGKKIGLVVGSIAHNLLSNLLKANNLSISDVELINLSTGEQEQALVTGQVDAVVTWDPTFTKAVADEAGQVLADGTGVFLGENPIIARTEYVEQNPEIVQIFLNEYQKAVAELLANKDTYAEKYSEDLGLDAELVITALSHTNEPVVITENDAEDLQGTVDFLYESEIITESFDVTEYIDYTFSEGIE